MYAIAFVSSCESNVSGSTQESNVLLSKPPVKFHIVYVSWDSWGRTSLQCNGWGLCDFESCSFCCTDSDEQIVPCKDQPADLALVQSKIYIDNETKEGYLSIEFDPSKVIENDAIINEAKFYIDTDITKVGVTLHAGEYSFDKNIGAHGGIKLPLLKIS